MNVSRYHRLPIAQKRAEGLTRMRTPSVTCPLCDTQVMPTDLLAHLELRCSGLREPGPGDKWLTWKEALALGVSGMNLSLWSRPDKNGRIKVRARGNRGDRQYLERDLQVWLTLQKAARRRQ